MTPLPAIEYGAPDIRRLARLWELSTPAHRDCMLWDLAPADKFEQLYMLCLHASICGMAWHDGQPLALSWVNLPFTGAGTGYVHFMFCTHLPCELRLAMGREFLAAAFQSHDCLLCLIPANWCGPNSFARSLGFGECWELPGACWLYRQQKARAGRLWKMTKEDFENAKTV